jgi:hypothetical protein
MDPLTRILVSATFGISIALNTVDGGSILTDLSDLSDLSDSSTSSALKSILPPLFLILTILFLLADLALFFHILLFEPRFTSALAISTTILAFFLLLLATIFDFPANYKILTSVQFVLQLSLPILLFREGDV